MSARAQLLIVLSSRPLFSRSKKKGVVYERKLYACDVARRTYLVVAYPLIVILGVLVQPHFAQPYAVPLEHVHAAAPLVGRTFPKDVTHV